MTSYIIDIITFRTFLISNSIFLDLCPKLQFHFILDKSSNWYIELYKSWTKDGKTSWANEIREKKS